jgi:PDZ domain
MSASSWRRVLLPVAILLILPGARAQSPSPSSLGVTTENGAVPFLLENGLLYLAGSLLVGNPGDSPQLSFVVDTGSTVTSLDPAVAHAAGYSAGGTVPLLVARRNFPQQKFSLASTDYISALSGRPTAGVLGQPQFARYSLAVDFDRQQAALLSPEICPSSATRVPVFTAGGLPFVEGTLTLADGGQATGLFLVDTGQPGPGIILASGFVTAHPGLTGGLATSSRLEQPAAGNGHAATLVRLRDLHLGPLTLHAPIAEVGPAGSAADTPRLAGVLGLEALSRFNFVLNQRYASLYLEPNQRMHEPFEADMSGISLSASADRTLVVAAVGAGSPAAAAHVQAGDVLVRMEDKPLVAANLGSVTAALRSAPGATVHLELERNGKPERVSFQLKRML